MSRVFPFLAVRDEVRARIRARNEKWEVAPTAAHWVEDFYPDEWAKVKECRLRYTPAESLTREDKWTLKCESSCRKIPWCIPCSLAKGNERTAIALDKISLATPKRQPKRVIPWTLNAPIYEEGRGVGVAASQNINRFAKCVAHFLHDVYDAKPGELGWIMSYQDFGEQAFKKRHPHWHLTMNGYRWRDGAMTPIDRLVLQGKGRDKVVAKWENALRIYFPGSDTANLRAEMPAVGKGAYYKWVKYQVRELIDLRKIKYNRAANLLTYIPYREGVVRAEFTGQLFRAGLEEYRARVRPDVGNRVHRDAGYMEGASLKKLSAEIGSTKERHDKATCPCDECDEWLGMPELRPYAMGWNDQDERSWLPA